MSGFTSIRGSGSAALRFVLLAAMLAFAAGTSQAGPFGGRGSGGGGHAYGGGGRTHGGGGGYGGGGGHYSGGGRTYGGGGRTYGGAWRGYGGGGSYGGSWRGYSGGRYYGGGTHYYGGGGYYYRPYGYRYFYPRSYVSFGFGLGAPYYYGCYRPVRHVIVESEPVVVDPGTTIDVTNYPPAGCYYYDRFCDERFSDLDDYTDHIRSHDHAATIEIIESDSGDRIRTLEFVDGTWGVQR